MSIRRFCFDCCQLTFKVILMMLLYFVVIPNGFSAIISDGTPKIVLASADAFVFNPRNHSWAAINGRGHVVRSGHGSGGRGYCPDIHRGCHTPTGTYHVISKGGPGCRSSRYPVGHGGAKMPYCMFFSKYYAIHGSDEVPNYNASHGCIRVHPGDAKWLSEHFVRVGTKVVVKPY